MSETKKTKKDHEHIRIDSNNILLSLVVEFKDNTNILIFNFDKNSFIQKKKSIKNKDNNDNNKIIKKLYEKNFKK